MLSFRRPKECEASRYRHGCDPPKTIQAAPSSEFNDQSPTSSLPLKQSLIPLMELQPSLLDSVYRFHPKRRK
jgi:hypothetical protein